MRHDNLTVVHGIDPENGARNKPVDYQEGGVPGGLISLSIWEFSGKTGKKKGPRGLCTYEMERRLDSKREDFYGQRQKPDKDKAGIRP
jgi:hypothetical protein